HGRAPRILVRRPTRDGGARRGGRRSGASRRAARTGPRVAEPGGGAVLDRGARLLWAGAGRKEAPRPERRLEPRASPVVRVALPRARETGCTAPAGRRHVLRL